MSRYDDWKYTPDKKPKTPLQRFADKLFGPKDEAITGETELQKEMAKEKVKRGI